MCMIKYIYIYYYIKGEWECLLCLRHNSHSKRLPNLNVIPFDILTINVYRER